MYPDGKVSLDSFLESYTNTNARWTAVLNVQSETIKSTQNNLREYLHVLGVSKNFLDETLKALILKKKEDKVDYVKIKNVCDMIWLRVKRQVRVGDTIPTN